jgi:hypothetical protein
MGAPKKKADKSEVILHEMNRGETSHGKGTG